MLSTLLGLGGNDIGTAIVFLPHRCCEHSRGFTLPSPCFPSKTDLRTVTLNLSLIDTFYMNGPCTRQSPRKEAGGALIHVSLRYRDRKQSHSPPWPKKLGQSQDQGGNISGGHAAGSHVLCRRILS